MSQVSVCEFHNIGVSWLLHRLLERPFQKRNGVFCLGSCGRLTHRLGCGFPQPDRQGGLGSCLFVISIFPSLSLGWGGNGGKAGTCLPVRRRLHMIGGSRHEGRNTEVNHVKPAAGSKGRASKYGGLCG